STLVGDKVEVEALNDVIGSEHRRERGAIRIGSVKSMIGHLKSAAGAASVIKTALALYHGTFPPSLHFRDARTDVPLDVIPLKVQTDPEPWPTTPSGLRRAGVSAFGFGGTNFHVVLESYAGQQLATAPTRLPTLPQPVQPRPTLVPTASVAPAAASAPPSVELVSSPARVQHGVPSGLWATSGSNEAELIANLEALADGRHAPFHASAPLR
ncbi:MAG: hypothetical protein KC656_36915, partial [Myxococcales bacterium]|nr:hypothetical protein [Myxococcales bacterium]